MCVCVCVCVCPNTHSALCAWLLFISVCVCVCVCVCLAAKSLANRSGGVEREEKVTQHRYTLIRHWHMHLVYFRSWTAIQWADCLNWFFLQVSIWFGAKSVFCVLSERLFVCYCVTLSDEVLGNHKQQLTEVMALGLPAFFIHDCLCVSHTHTHLLKSQRHT